MTLLLTHQSSLLALGIRSHFTICGVTLWVDLTIEQGNDPIQGSLGNQWIC